MTARSPVALVLAVSGLVLFGVVTVLVLRARPRSGPGERDAVAVYLTPWASSDELLRIYTTALGTANPNDRGFTLHEGIVGVSLTGNEEQTILIVRFGDTVRRARRDSLLAGIRASPLVTRVAQNSN